MAAQPKLAHLAAALLCAIFTATPAQTPAQRAIDAARTQAPAAAALEVTPLAAICADPSPLVGTAVRCHFQFESEMTTWNPFLTRFGSDDYRALRVWGDEQMLWKREEWEAPLGVLFVRRDSDVAKLFEHAPKYARFEIVGRVRQVFHDMPWIEIDGAQRLAPEIGEGALLHASRALQLIAGEQWQMASDDLDRALIGNLPDKARAELLRLRDDCKAHTKRK
jgi:hypothetical protein